MAQAGLGVQVDNDTMVLEVLSWYYKAPLAEQFDFKYASEPELIDWHDSLGRDIRNIFKLWDRPWVPNIVNGTDISDQHPDQISMSIIEEVWRRVNGT